MNKDIQLGKINQLRINRASEPGLYLTCENEDEVLLPNIYITADMQVGELLDVFVYTDSEDRLVSTTLKPYGMLNDFVALEVIDTSKFGAFLDWGLPKDLLVPKNKQRTTFNVGDIKVVQILEDERTNRLIGNEKFSLQTVEKKYSRNDEVDILLYKRTPLGFKVIVDNKYDGMIYHSEIFEKIQAGSKKRAYIKYVRDDGKIDVSLQKIGAKKSDENHHKVLDILNQKGGKLPFTYKSEPKAIKEVFGLSKKAFKLALTQLIDSKKIVLKEDAICVINTSS